MKKIVFIILSIGVFANASAQNFKVLQKRNVSVTTLLNKLHYIGKNTLGVSYGYGTDVPEGYKPSYTFSIIYVTLLNEICR